MKRIGMIGGIGWASTVDYYRYLNQMACKKLGVDHSANLLLLNLDSGVIRKLADEGQEEKIYQMILGAAQTLKEGGAEILVLCANGVHRFASRLQAEGALPIVHIVEATSQSIQKASLKKVGLLGIKKTMEGTFYSEILKRDGIEILIPPANEREFLDQTIYDELMQEKFLPSTKQRYLKIIQDLKDAGAEGIILGCTEIPLLIQQSDVSIPVFVTSEIHCAAVIRSAFEVLI